MAASVRLRHDGIAARPSMNRLYRSGPATAENARRRWRKADGQILYRDHHQHRHGGWYGRARHSLLILRDVVPLSGANAMRLKKYSR